MIIRFAPKYLACVVRQMLVVIILFCAVIFLVEPAQAEPTLQDGIAFGEGQNIGTSQNLFRGLAAADLDGDGDLDVVATGGVDSAYEVTVWRNDGASFGDQWPHQHVGSPENQVYRVVAVDLDQDGRLDVVTSGNYDNAFEIMSWRNDGTPFDGAWQRQNIGKTVDNCNQIQAGDLDHDGDLDLVAGCSWREDYKVIGWENDGTPFDGQLWPAHNLGTFHCGPYSLDLADFDGDGWLDIAAGGDFCNGPEKIFIWQNDKTPFDSLWPRTEVGACVASATVNSTVAADIDLDGDLDLVTGCGPAEEYDIKVWENDGSPFDDAWLQHEVGALQDRVWPVVVGDLNSDGYPEIISGNYAGPNHELIVWENGSDPFTGLWPQHDIGQSDSNVLALTLGDLDADGDIDIVSGSQVLDIWKNQTSAIINKPDLSISEIRVTPAAPDVNEDIIVDILVRNKGNRQADPFLVHWQPYPSHQGYLRPISGLAAGGEQTVTFAHIYTTPGDFLSLTMLDSEDAIDEISERNNRTTTKVSVTSQGTLDVTIISPLPASTVYHGGTLLVKASVQHQGNAVTDAVVKGAIPLKSELTSPNANVTMPIDLFDDGNHEDGERADGIYAARASLYGPQTMPVTGNPYAMTVMAQSGEFSDSDSLSLYMDYTSGTPEVGLDIQPSGAPYLAGDEVLVTAVLTYPNHEVHPGSQVNLRVTQPNLDVEDINLAPNGSNSWQVNYQFPDGKDGQFYFDVRAAPPSETRYVDGWAASRVNVDLHPLDIEAISHPEAYLMYSSIPLTACVSADSIPVNDAFVEARILSANSQGNPGNEEMGITAPNLTPIAKLPGCYEGHYLATDPGDYVVHFFAQRAGYLDVWLAHNFTVADNVSTLRDYIADFGNAAVEDSEQSMGIATEIARDGDWFASKITQGENQRVVNAILGVIDIAGSSASAYKAIQIYKSPGLNESLRSIWLNQFALGDIIDSAIIESGRIVTEDAGHMLLEAPLRFYATRGEMELDTGVDLRDYAAIEYENALTEGDTALESNFVHVLGPFAENVQRDIAGNTVIAITQVPTSSVTLSDELLVIQDLEKRRGASHWLSTGELSYRAGLLFHERDRRQEDEENWTDEILFIAGKMAIRVAAGAVCDGPCIVGVAAADTALTFYLDSKQIEADQRMRDYALNLLHPAYDVQALLWSNTHAGLSTAIIPGRPATPSGFLEEIQPTRTIRHGFERDVYVDFTITNPDNSNTSVPVQYAVKAYYQRDNGASHVNQNVEEFGTQAMLLDLLPGQSRRVRLYFKKGNEFDDGMPADDGVFRLNLYAFTENGAYLVDEEIQILFKPETVPHNSQNLVASSTTEGDALAEAQAINADALNGIVDYIPNYPIINYVTTESGSLTNTIAIFVENPWPHPVTVSVRQPISHPKGNWRPQGTWYFEEQPIPTVVWHQALQPHDVIDFRADYLPAAEYAGMDVEILPAVVEFYHAASDSVITLSGDPITATVKIPFMVEGISYNRYVEADSHQSVIVNLKNIDKANSQQGTLIMTCTVNGATACRTEQAVVLPADTSQNFTVEYTIHEMGIGTLEIYMQLPDQVPIALSSVSIIVDDASSSNGVFLPLIQSTE